MEAITTGENVFDNIQNLFFLVFGKRKLQRSDFHGVAAEGQGRRLPARQYFTVESLDHWLWKDEAGLMFGEQPVDVVFFPGNALVFAKSLAPTSEIGRIALGFTFEHFNHLSTVDRLVEFAMLHDRN